jgi:gas vesicle protein
MRNDEGYGAGSVFFAFMLGGIVGAGVALLLAPQSGRDTRQKIREFAEDVRDKADDYIDTVKDKVSSTVHKGKDYIGDKKTLISTAVDAGKEAYAKEKKRLEEQG